MAWRGVSPRLCVGAAWAPERRALGRRGPLAQEEETAREEKALSISFISDDGEDSFVNQAHDELYKEGSNGYSIQSIISGMRRGHNQVSS